MYKRQTQVTYSDVNYKGEVGLKKILEYFQDIGTFESEEGGDGVTQNQEEGIAWFLLGWHVTILRAPKLIEKITVTTQPYKIRGFYAYRRYTIMSENGECLVKGDALWIYMNTEKMIPVKVPENVAKIYLPEPVKDAKTTVKRKLNLDGDWKSAGEIIIQRHHLDMNQHVNNTFYELWAENLVPDEENVKEIRIDYRQAAFRGDKLNILLCKEEKVYRVLFQGEDEVIHVIVELYI